MELTYFFRPLRIMLEDYDASARQYPDDVLSDGVRTAVMLGKLPAYSLTTDLNSITPDITDPNLFALLTYHTVRLFVAPLPDRRGFRTRGFSESQGSLSRYLSLLEAEIHALENSGMFSGWQSYYAWLHGMAGLPLGEVLAQFDVQAPLWKATFTRDGMKVA